MHRIPFMLQWSYNVTTPHIHVIVANSEIIPQIIQLRFEQSPYQLPVFVCIPKINWTVVRNFPTSQSLKYAFMTKNKEYYVLYSFHVRITPKQQLLLNVLKYYSPIAA